MQRRVIWLLAGVAGGIVAFAGTSAALWMLLVIRGEGSLTTAETLPSAALAGLALGLGFPLAAQGVAAWRQQPSSLFAPSRVGWLVFAWAVVLGLGWAVSGIPRIAPILLPLFHILAMALPPLILLGLVGRALRGIGATWREVIASLAGGGLAGLGLALVAEIVAVLALVLVGTLVVSFTPGGPERIREWSQRLQDLAQQVDPAELLNLLMSSPLVVVGALTLVSIIVPVVEETSKTLVVGVAGRWVQPHPAQAFLWGVTSGVGFAVAENLFNGALGGAESWALGALARVGATIMHCATGALVGWGWGQLWTARRPGRMVACYLAAIAGHGIWNAMAAGSAILGVAVATQGGNTAVSAFAGAIMLFLVGVLLLTAGALLAGLFVAARFLTRQHGSDRASFVS